MTSIKTPETDRAVKFILAAVRGDQDPWHVFERYIERLREVLDVTLATRAAKDATTH